MMDYPSLNRTPDNSYNAGGKIQAVPFELSFLIYNCLSVFS